MYLINAWETMWAIRALAAEGHSAASGEWGELAFSLVLAVVVGCAAITYFTTKAIAACRHSLGWGPAPEPEPILTSFMAIIALVSIVAHLAIAYEAPRMHARYFSDNVLEPGNYALINDMKYAIAAGAGCPEGTRIAAAIAEAGEASTAVTEQTAFRLAQATAGCIRDQRVRELAALLKDAKASPSAPDPTHSGAAPQPPRGDG